jgi:iron-sulfur cluster insertion protein
LAIAAENTTLSDNSAQNRAAHLIVHPMIRDSGTTIMTTEQNTVRVSTNAAEQINAITATEAANKLLRISVEGGGCSGFQYKFNLVAESDADDLVIEKEGATVLVDPMSLPFLEGAELDYVQELIGASFKVNNPNAQASCGCGTSFTI